MMDDKELDKLLDALARETQDPSPDLMGRILGDAYDAQPVPTPDPAPALSAPPSRRKGILQVFGGWSGLGGLAAAASIGFFMGFSPPQAVQSPLNSILGVEFAEDDSTVSGFGWDIEEG
jgi:hypothetical protein